MAKKLMKGNEAIGEAAIVAGAQAYFCYPITPQTEVAEYLAKRMPEVGGVFVQAESELAASQMIFGAAAAGARAFTTSSSPGISLMGEAMSYIAAAELPAVFINIIRCGPGLGGILPSQGDYLQATKGGGHGDYRFLVLAPSTVQETVDLTIEAFRLADKYRNPVLLIGDGLIGQMMEPVDFEGRGAPPTLDTSAWATTGCVGREPHIVKTLFLDPNELERRNRKMRDKYEQMKREEVRFEAYLCDDAPELLVAAYGTTARVVRTAIDRLREDGVKVGMFRPISVFPFPDEPVRQLAFQPSVRSVLVVEMSMGQMLEDVERALQGRRPIHFYGRGGGNVPAPEELVRECRRLLGNGQGGRP
ncbi:MAG: 3-methyl-2-oxobutanoate dehydrogenase subunit VorB [Deltaproteobacteria bacterium]|nr:3-methyl-2-oxobutanoate dehydrogenase subunit VorB [Deltaproteobacteria bacterium]